MSTNTSSTGDSTGRPDRLAALTAAVDALAALDLDGLTDAALAEQVLALRRLVDRLEGHWRNQLAGVDARGPPGPTTTKRLARPPVGWGTGCA